MKNNSIGCLVALIVLVLGLLALGDAAVWLTLRLSRALAATGPLPASLVIGLVRALEVGAFPVVAVAGVDVDLVERVVRNYRLLLDDGVVRVDSSLLLTNKSKPTTRRGPCKNGKGTCKIKTRYYFFGWDAWWAPSNALNPTVSGAKVASKPVAEVGGGLAYGITYPKLWNKKGAKQKASFSFDIPAGTVGSTDEPTRIEDGYAYFCYWGMAGDTGTTRAILPPGWEPVGRREDVSVEYTPEGAVLKAKNRKDPFEFIHCVEAVDPDRLDRTYVTGEAGKSLVAIESWPTHAAWAEDMQQVAAEALPNLETMLGTTMPGGELRVREVATQSRRYTYGDDRPTDGILGMDEDADARMLASRLARRWIDPAQFEDRWLEAGVAHWLASQAAADTPCGDAGQHPGPDAPDLDAWVEVTSPELVELGNWQNHTACTLVASAADIVGPERMVELVVELIEAPVPVGTSHWLAGVSRDLPEGLVTLVAALDAAGVDH